MRPRLLDLFCGGGGAGMGYFRAGFDVTGVDIDPQPSYPFRRIQGDALEFISRHGASFDVIHASPPCQSYSRHVTSSESAWNDTRGKAEPGLLEPLRLLMMATGRPYVIENVMGAPLQDPFVLCGAMFGLPIQRHRQFESNMPIPPPDHPNCRGIAKRFAEENGWDYRDMSVTGKGRNAGTSARWSHLLGIDWQMRQHDLKEAIPPAYTEFIGHQLLAVMQRREAA